MKEIIKSSGIVVVKNIHTVPLYLLLSSNGYWDFPKGKVDDGETEFIAALRETEEESGLKNLTFPWGGVYVETKPYSTFVENRRAKKVARYYIGSLVSGEPEIRPNPHTGIVEHDKYKWVSSAQKDGLSLIPRIRTVFEWAIKIVEGKQEKIEL